MAGTYLVIWRLFCPVVSISRATMSSERRHYHSTEGKRGAPLLGLASPLSAGGETDRKPSPNVKNQLPTTCTHWFQENLMHYLRYVKTNESPWNFAARLHCRCDFIVWRKPRACWTPLSHIETTIVCSNQLSAHYPSAFTFAALVVVHKRLSLSAGVAFQKEKIGKKQRCERQKQIEK